MCRSGAMFRGVPWRSEDALWRVRSRDSGTALTRSLAARTRAREVTLVQPRMRISAALLGSQPPGPRGVLREAPRGKLPADELLEELMGLATDIAITPEIIQAAKDRYNRGNPPGKEGSYGDAITWEALLQHHPGYATLDIITDSDYLSPLRRKELHEFLEREWDALKHSKVTVYENLSIYLQVHYPDIKLSTEVASGVAISRLEESGAFATTHGAIEALGRISDFSAEQVQRLVDAGLDNNQVNMILLDHDVKAFYDWLLDNFGDEADHDSVAKLRAQLIDDDESF